MIPFSPPPLPKKLQWYPGHEPRPEDPPSPMRSRGLGDCPHARSLKLHSLEAKLKHRKRSRNTRCAALHAAVQENPALPSK